MGNWTENHTATNNMNRRVVVTGIGIWSCIGNNVQEVRDSLYQGKSGIGIAEDRTAYGYRSPLTGIVQHPDMKGLIGRRQREGMSEQAEYAFMASQEAFNMSVIDPQYREENEIGVIFGNDSSAKAIVEADHIMRSHSIGLGYTLIRQGLQDIILCGGAQEVNKYAMSSFDALGVFSNNTDCPTKASRPFDRDRTGLVPSGGAAALILEDYEHAVRRGARILAEVCGYGFSSNGGAMSAASDQGSYIAMNRALADARIQADAVDYINAHATGTPQGDMLEAIAIDRLFGGKKAYISSTKSMTGHECWMAGASEAVYSIIMMQAGFIAPNINLETPDEYSSRLNIARHRIDTDIDIILSNSFGFGGTNSALVLKKH